MTIDPEARPLVLSEAVEFGGAERSLLAMARFLYERGLSCYLLVYRDHCDIASYAAHPLPVVVLAPKPGMWNKVSALRRHLAARPPHAPRPLCSGYQPALHTTLAGVRGFHTLMHDTPSLFGDAPRRSWKAHLRISVSNCILRLGLRSGGVTIVTSEFLRAECRRDFGVEAKIVRMGGLATRLQRSALAQAGRLNLLSVCRIEDNKRIDWMLRALARLEHGTVEPLPAPLSSLADWRLDLAGKGSRIEELMRLAESLKIADRVRFRGFVPDGELEEMYADANLFLMPAVQGYGLPAIESLKRGVPVLLHRESGVSDILLNTPWATVMEGGEEGLTPALARAIGGVLAGDHFVVEPPRLPTEEQWASEVATLCGWLPDEPGNCA